MLEEDVEEQEKGDKLNHTIDQTYRYDINMCK